MFSKILIYSSFLVSILFGAHSTHASILVFDEDQSRRNDSLLTLLSYTNHYKGYEEDYEVFANEYNEQQRQLGGKYSIINVEASAANQEIADHYARGIMAVMCNQRTIDSFIHTLLSDRLERLKERSTAKSQMFKKLEEFRRDPSKFETQRITRVAYTHPSMIEKHYGDDPVMRRQASGDTTFYQFVNSLIAGLYKLAEPRELSEKTRLLIRSSPCLHGLLKGETDDLGHPDEAIYQDASDPAGKLFDLDFYETHILKSELVTIPLIGYSKGQTMQIYMTQYDRSQEDRSYYYKGILPLPYPEWIAPKVVAVSAPQCSTSFAGGAPTSGKQTVPTASSESKPPKSTILAPIDTNSSQGKKKLSSPSSQEAVKDDRDTEIEDKMESIPTSSAVISARESEDTKVDQAIQVDALDQIIEGMNNLNVSESPDDLTPLQPKKRVSKEQAQSVASSSSDQDRLAPRGMRVFHSRQNHQFTTLRSGFEDLAGTHATTLSSIHHYQQFKNVSYKLFASLWRHINGPDSIKESTGSSHIALLDANGRVVGGTFAHGPSMTYSKKTIGYIREALSMIGFGLESKEDALVQRNITCSSNKTSRKRID